jgi:hypothetical protein
MTLLGVLSVITNQFSNVLIFIASAVIVIPTTTTLWRSSTGKANRHQPGNIVDIA